MRELAIFDPVWVGVPAAIMGIGFIILFSKRLLPEPKEGRGETVEKRWYTAEFVVEAESLLVGKTAKKAGLAETDGYNLVSIFQPNEDEPKLKETELTVRQWFRKAVEEEISHEPTMVKRLRRVMVAGDGAEASGIVRQLQKVLAAKPQSDARGVPDEGFKTENLESYILQGGDILAFVTDVASIPPLWSISGLLPYVSPIEMSSKRHTHRLVEVVVSPDSPAVGRHVSQLPVRPDPLETRLRRNCLTWS